MVEPKKDNGRPWREVARRVAHEATLREAEARWGVGDHPANYRWTHVQAVVAHAMRLAELTGADPDVVEAAAWLHDSAKQGKDDDHGIAGAIEAREVLAGTDFPPEKLDAVAGAIAKHVGLYVDEPVAPLAAAVLWDADKLTKLGAAGSLLQIAAWILAGSGPLDDLPASVDSQDWFEKTVESFHTAPAREAGCRRLAAQRAFWARVAKELAGDDLGSKAEDEEDR
ncbi:MAG: HD domain-containing protein [Anaerolineae bacterium]|nr:HD domain-containing protein [Anaerolineae bacterium]